MSVRLRFKTLAAYLSYVVMMAGLLSFRCAWYASNIGCKFMVWQVLICQNIHHIIFIILAFAFVQDVTPVAQIDHTWLFAVRTYELFLHATYRSVRLRFKSWWSISAML